jgi:hypothetical protein
MSSMGCKIRINTQSRVEVKKASKSLEFRTLPGLGNIRAAKLKCLSIANSQHLTPNYQDNLRKGGDTRSMTE